MVREGEAWLFNAHISPYAHGNRENHEPTRTRKLLLHKGEIERLSLARSGEGPDPCSHEVLFQERIHQVRARRCRGKKLYDKRETEARKTQEREARALIKQKTLSRA